MKGAKDTSTVREKSARGKRKASATTSLEFDFKAPAIKEVKKQRASSTILVPTPTADSEGDIAMTQLNELPTCAVTSQDQPESPSQWKHPDHEFFVVHVNGSTHYGIFPKDNSLEPFGEVCKKKTARFWLRPMAGQTIVLSNDHAVFMENSSLLDKADAQNARAAAGKAPALRVYHTEVIDQPKDTLTSHIFSVAYNKASASRYAGDLTKKRGASEMYLGETVVCNNQPNKLHTI